MADHVAAGELIESAWGNEVVDEIAANTEWIGRARTRLVTQAVGTFDRPAIEAKIAQVTTDSSGNASVTFTQPFATVPTVMTVASADYGLNYVIIPYDTVTTGTAFAVNAANAAGVAQASVVVRFMYIAIGTWS